MFEEYQSLIQAARERVYAVARRTELHPAPLVGERTGHRVFLKREDQQPVFSYKLRGAYNLIRSLSAEEKSAGVIAASAGNHAQGVALAAQKEGLPALIVLPKSTPEIKVAAVRRLRAEVLMHGSNYDEACEHAEKLAGERGLTLIPPYDHPLVIAGQATVGVEILEQHPATPDVIFVPVGGGGLIAGIAVYIKAQNPGIRIIGVEPDEAPSLHHALRAGERVCLDQIGLFADGAAVRQVGKEPFRIARELVDEVLLVNIDEICAAVKDIFEDTRAIPEPAGALALAGLKQFVQSRSPDRDPAPQDLVAIFSGSNVNFDRLRHIAELSALGAQREALIGSPLPERPGSFRRFCHLLGPRLITEFNYRYADHDTAHVFAGVQLRRGEEEKETLLQSLRDHGYEAVDLSHNELAKVHIRYMIGGPAPQAQHELLYRFVFPERPGALLRFLNGLEQRWNISLFHYRNHGSAYGRVLMGIQVPPAEREDFRTFLDQLGYQYWAEFDNPAYQMFLT